MVTAVICCVLVAMSIASVFGVVALARTNTLDPRKDPALLAYLAARNYTAPPRIDARPPSIGALYRDAVFGTANGLSFALTVTTYRSQSTTAIFLTGDGTRVGTWFCTRRGSSASSNADMGVVARMFVSTTTNDSSFDARFETYQTGHDGPSHVVRALLLSFPSDIETIGWTEGRVIVSMATNREVDAARLDAAFALARAIVQGQ